MTKDKRGRAYYASRAETMQHFYEDGATLEEIGAAWNVTRERARQVLRKAGVPPRERADSATDVLRIVTACREANSISGAAAKCHKPVVKIEECLRELGMWEAVSRLWRMRYSRRIPDRVLIARMQEIGAIVGHAPTASELNHHKPPSQTYMQHFGSMQKAQAAAGFKPRGVGRKTWED